MKQGRTWADSGLSSILLTFLTVTGLAVAYLPFSGMSQTAVLAHVVLGVLGLWPIVAYLLRHARAYWEHPLTHYKVSGWVMLGLLAGLVVSGAVLTWEAAAELRIGYTWRAVHLWATWALVAAAGGHLGVLAVRAVRAGGGQVIRGYGRTLGLGSLMLTVAWGAWSGWEARTGQATWDNSFPEGYGMPYGDERPFAPSLATTASGGAMDSRSLAGAAGCGQAGCHAQIYKEWLPSAHRYAAMDPGFQVIQKTMAEQNGPESTRYCAGCHDPISLFSGTKNVLVDSGELTGQAGYNEGISCASCHAIERTDVKGNAAYVMAQPSRYMYELAAADDLRGAVGRFLIRAYPDEHLRTYSRRMFKTPEFCAACHKQFIDEEVNKVGWVQLQNQFDNWRKSHWNCPGDAAKTVECRECHMPLQASNDPGAGDPVDYNRSPEDGRHRSHRFLGANQWIPTVLKLDGAEEHVALTERWLRGEVEVPEIADKWKTGAVVPIQVVAPKEVAPGDSVKLKVVLTSNKVGHDFPTGPLDIIQTWVDLRVEAANGQVLFASGRIDDKRFIEPGTFMFKAEPVDQQGDLIDRHNLWEMVGVRYRRALFPGFSDTARYTFEVPADVATSGPIKVSATLRYRKFDQFLLDFAFGKDSGLTARVTDLASASAEIALARLGG